MSSATTPKTPPTQTAKLSVAGHDIELPVVVGTENELGIDISSLRKETGCVTLDEGYVNTGNHGDLCKGDQREKSRSSQ